MFIGEFTHSVDKKGRAAIPSKFRPELAEGAVVTRGLDGCLFVYPKRQWEKIAEKFASLPLSQSKTRAFTRLMLAGAMDVNLDSQGRILIPEYLRTYANISEEAVIAGLYNRLEIWSKQAWEEYKESTEEKSEEIAEKLSELGVWCFQILLSFHSLQATVHAVVRGCGMEASKDLSAK